jgi:p-aminobenzoyl-glutamate transporter AbgT
MMLKSYFRWIAPLAVVVALASVAAACPTCSEGLASSDPQHQSLAAGFYYSILFMMSMPFAILGTFGGLAYSSIRRAREQQRADGEADTAADAC